LNLITLNFFILSFYFLFLCIWIGIILFIYSKLFIVLFDFDLCFSVCISLGWQAGAGSHAARGACGGV